MNVVTRNREPLRISSGLLRRAEILLPERYLSVLRRGMPDGDIFRMFFAAINPSFSSNGISKHWVGGFPSDSKAVRDVAVSRVSDAAKSDPSCGYVVQFRTMTISIGGQPCRMEVAVLAVVAPSGGVDGIVLTDDAPLIG